MSRIAGPTSSTSGSGSTADRQGRVKLLEPEDQLGDADVEATDDPDQLERGLAAVAASGSIRTPA